MTSPSRRHEQAHQARYGRVVGDGTRTVMRFSVPDGRAASAGTRRAPLRGYRCVGTAE